VKDAQHDEIRAAASLLLGHFRAEAAAHLERAGAPGQLALDALHAGEDTMIVHARLRRLLDAAAPRGAKKGRGKDAA
jgi:hypothetical protein